MQIINLQYYGSYIKILLSMKNKIKLVCCIYTCYTFTCGKVSLCCNTFYAGEEKRDTFIMFLTEQ